MTPERLDRALRPAVYGAWAIFLFHLAVSGQARLFVRPAFVPLFAAVAILLTILVAVEAFSADGHRHFRLSPAAALLLAAPLLWTLCARPRGLPPGAAARRSAGGAVSVDSGELLRALQDTAAVEGRYRRLTVKHILGAVRDRGAEMDGMCVATEGFLVKDAGGWRVVRFLITCCAADATAIGVPVEPDTVPAPPPDSWVVVRGTLRTAGGRAVIAADEIAAAPPPRDTYLY